MQYDSDYAEDFAESTAAFIASKDTPCEQVFKKTFPARYEILKEIL